MFHLFTVKMTVFNGYKKYATVFQIYLRLRKTFPKMQIIHLLHILKASSLPKEYFISFVPSWAVKSSLSLICLLDFEHLISNVMLQVHACCVCFKGQIRDSPRCCHSGIAVSLRLHLPLSLFYAAFIFPVAFCCLRCQK